MWPSREAFESAALHTALLSSAPVGPSARMICPPFIERAQWTPLCGAGEIDSVMIEPLARPSVDSSDSARSRRALGDIPHRSRAFDVLRRTRSGNRCSSGRQANATRRSRASSHAEARHVLPIEAVGAGSRPVETAKDVHHVDLPEPDWPTMARIRPGISSRRPVQHLDREDRRFDRFGDARESMRGASAPLGREHHGGTQFSLRDLLSSRCQRTGAIRSPSGKG